MTVSATRTRKTDIQKMALLTAFACVLQISESMIPHPVPGLRLGLANMITLVALVRLGFRCAMEIAVLRTLLSAIIIGTFMSPTFLLSISGAVASTLGMGGLMWVARRRSRTAPSIIGISIIGALIHNMVQLYLAYFLLVRHGGVFVFFPWLCAGALIMGWINGVVAGAVCRRLTNEPCSRVGMDGDVRESEPLRIDQFQAGNALLYKLPAEIKIGAVFVLATTVLIIGDIRLMACLFGFLGLIAAISRISAAYLLSKVLRFTSLLLVAFLLPVLFNDGTDIFFRISGLAITGEGIYAGAAASLRIMFLIMVSALVMRTTSPTELTAALGNLMRPVKFFGISDKRMAEILAMSWTFIPSIWDIARDRIRKGKFTNVKNIRNLLPMLVELIATLYNQTETEGGPRNTVAGDCSGELAGRSHKPEAGDESKADSDHCSVRDDIENAVYRLIHVETTMPASNQAREE
ncbi:MAG: Gx transporter family protein [Desulfobacterales bacterium]